MPTSDEANIKTSWWWILAGVLIALATIEICLELILLMMV